MPNHAESALEVRLDKWLWAARFYKTRSIARDQIDGGKVHYNGQRSKPGKQVEVGALIRFWQGQDEREVRVLALSEQRKSDRKSTRLNSSHVRTSRMPSSA